jgi:hypothetical protein
MRKHGCFAAGARLWLVFLVACVAGALAGCSSETSPAPLAAAIDAASPLAAPSAPNVSPQGHPRETWDALFLGGAKVGYMRTTLTDTAEDGAKRVRIDTTNCVTVNRSGQATEHTITATSIETPGGGLVRFHATLRSGATPTQFTGSMDGNQLVVNTETAGKVTTERIPWPAGAGGLMAMEQSLLRQPMQPGERRQVTGLMAVVNQAVTMELVAEKLEPTKLLQHSEDLLRVDCRAKMPDGTPIVERLWVNRDGVILKRQIDALQQETYRTTKELALADVGPAKFDLMLDTTVPVNRPLDNPHATRRIRYRLKLKTNDPAQVFARCASQEVTSLDSRTAEVVVQAIRPKRGAPSEADAETLPFNSTGTLTTSAPAVMKLPTDEDRAPNNLIQSDNPKIVSMARSIAPDETDPWTIATSLEQAVKNYIRRPNYSQALTSAADVVQNAEGDCTEHAVLLAALCRARGIPARVAIGLVYVPAAPGFGYHMWNEVWIDGQWIPLDATVARGGTGAAHLKLTDSNLQGTTAFSTFLSVAQVIGQLRIEIVEAE